MSFLKNIVRAFPFKASSLEKSPSVPKAVWTNNSICGLRKALQLIERREDTHESLPYDSVLIGYDTVVSALAHAIINNTESIDSVENLNLFPGTIIYILSSYCPIFPYLIEEKQLSLKDLLDDLPSINREACDCIINHLCNLMQDKKLNTEHQITPQYLFQRVGSVIFQIKWDGNRFLGHEKDIEIRREYFCSLLESHQKPIENLSIGNTIQDRSVKITFQDPSNRPNQEQLKSVLSPFGNIANIGFKEKIAVVLFSDWSEALCCAQEIQNIDVGFDLKVKYLGSHKWSELIAVKQLREAAEKEKKMVKVEPRESQGVIEESKVPVVTSNASSTSEVIPSTKGNGGGWVEARRVQVSPKISNETDAQAVSSAPTTSTATLALPTAVANDELKDKVDDEEKIEVSSIHSEGEANNSDRKVEERSAVHTISVKPVVQVDPTKSNSTPDKDRQEPKKKMIFFDYNDIDGSDDIQKVGEHSKQTSPAASSNKGKMTTKVIRVEDKQGLKSSPADAEVRRVSYDSTERHSDTGKESWKPDKASGVSPTSLRSATSSADRKSLQRIDSIASSVDVIEPYASSSEDNRNESLVRPQSLAVGDSTVGLKERQGKSPRDESRISSDSPLRVEKKAVAVDDNLDTVEYDQQDAVRSGSSSSSSTNKGSRISGNPSYGSLQSEVHPDGRKSRRKLKKASKKAVAKDNRSNSTDSSDHRKKDMHETTSNNSDESEEYHRQPEAYALPSQFKHQQDNEKAKLSEKLVQINFESQNREEELHQLQLKNFQLCEESWAAEIVKLSLRNTSLMEENNTLREAMRKMKLELSTTTAVLLAAEASKKSLELQLKALQERANREALSTVLSQNKMIATLESRLQDSESQIHVMEAEVSHTRDLHEKAVESVLYWKAMALRQGGDSNLHPNEALEEAKKETDSIALMTGKHNDSIEGGILVQRSSIEEDDNDNDDDIRVVDPPLQVKQDIGRSEERAPHDRVINSTALTESVTFDLPTLKKATEQELQECVPPSIPHCQIICCCSILAEYYSQQK
eukprot:gene24652-32105_t